MYILRVRRSEFVQIVSNKEYVITHNPDKASRFEKIGDAMRFAVIVRKLLGKADVRAVLI